MAVKVDKLLGVFRQNDLWDSSPGKNIVDEITGTFREKSQGTSRGMVDRILGKYRENDFFGNYILDENGDLIIDENGDPIPEEDNHYFITTWNTSLTRAGGSTAYQLILPLVSTGTYAFYVYWGDGTSNYITSYNQTEATHTYTVSGLHTVLISGTFIGLKTAYNESLKLVKISQWGCLKFTGMNGNQAFMWCTNLVCAATDAPDINSATSLDEFFRYCFGFTGDLSSWKTGNIHSLFAAFESCSHFESDLSGWDVSNVTNMSNLFSGVTNNTGTTTDLKINNWNVANVTNMYQMFGGDHGIIFDLRNWNISKVTNFTGFASYCMQFTTAKYDAMLNAWAQLSVRSNVAFTANSTHYSIAGQAARNILINTYGWTFTDGGLI